MNHVLIINVDTKHFYYGYEMAVLVSIAKWPWTFIQLLQRAALIGRPVL